MDFDNFKKRQEAGQRRRFNLFQDAFDQAMREKGDPRTLNDVMGGGQRQPPPPKPKELTAIEEAAHEISEATGESPEQSVLRAMGLLRSIVRHWQKGGEVKFVDGDGTEKTLKRRLK